MWLAALSNPSMPSFERRSPSQCKSPEEIASTSQSMCLLNVHCQRHVHTPYLPRKPAENLRVRGPVPATPDEIYRGKSETVPAYIPPRWSNTSVTTRIVDARRYSHARAHSLIASSRWLVTQVYIRVQPVRNQISGETLLIKRSNMLVLTINTQGERYTRARSAAHVGRVGGFFCSAASSFSS